MKSLAFAPHCVVSIVAVVAVVVVTSGSKAEKSSDVNFLLKCHSSKSGDDIPDSSGVGDNATRKGTAVSTDDKVKKNSSIDSDDHGIDMFASETKDNGIVSNSFNDVTCWPKCCFANQAFNVDKNSCEQVDPALILTEPEVNSLR